MMKIKNKIFALVTTFIFLFSLNIQLAQAQLAVLPGFNPNRLVEDSVFSDKNTFGGPDGIQRFLEGQKSVLANITPDFLVSLKEPNSSILKTALEDPRPNLDRLRTAAELIWDASQSSGLNPQVILVSLQKEQGLITTRQNLKPTELQRFLDIAMGFGCPDSGGCADLYRGFYFQLFGNLDAQNNRYLGSAKSLMKSFNTPGGRGPLYNGSVAKIGSTIVLSNTLGGYVGVDPEQTITLENAATAALYRYTPHVYNGNYNFWRYMNQWFKYPTGTIIQSPNGSLYMIQNGGRLLINDFIGKARGLNLSNKILLSFNELDSYPELGVLGLPDNTVVLSEGLIFVFMDNKKHPVSEFVLKQRGLSVGTAISASVGDLANYNTAPQLTPSEGTVLRGVQGPAVYMVENSQLRLISALVFAQRNLGSKIQLISDAELALYPKGGFLPPLNGTLVKSPADQTVYLIVERIKRPMTIELFRSHGFKFSDIKTISNDELSAIAIGSIAAPKDPTYYQLAGSGELYIYKNSSKHFVSVFVAKQRGITPDITFNVADTLKWPEGDAVMPKDGTLIKADNNPTVYIVERGQLLALSGADFKARKLSFSNLVTLSAVEVSKYSIKGSGDQ